MFLFLGFGKCKVWESAFHCTKHQRHGQRVASQGMSCSQRLATPPWLIQCLNLAGSLRWDFSQVSLVLDMIPSPNLLKMPLSVSFCFTLMLNDMNTRTKVMGKEHFSAGNIIHLFHFNLIPVKQLTMYWEKRRQSLISKLHRHFCTAF